MIRITAPGHVHTHVDLPASKSISNRVLLIDALSKGASRLENLSGCDDTQVMIRALTENPYTIDIRGAGTAMRFLTAYYSATEGEHILTGTQRMKQRPVYELVDALRKLGAEIRYAENEGFPPLHIRGKRLTGDTLDLKGNVSSQYISALLLIAPVLEKGLTLRLTGEVISRPYIDLTLHLMATFGVTAKRTGDNLIQIYPQAYHPVRFKVENDWSAASYWYEIAALSGEARIELAGLSADSLQGDRKTVDLFRQLGVETIFTGHGAGIFKTTRTVRKLEYDFTGQPDLAQTLAVTCVLKNIPFRFSGLQSLRIKETDRIAALVRELDKLGYRVKEHDGSVLYWDGQRKEPLPAPVIDTYEDHRMALAFAPASLVVPGIGIERPEVVSKSYPDFWEDLGRAGFTLKPSARC